jgi:hypothetical protein
VTEADVTPLPVSSAKPTRRRLPWLATAAAALLFATCLVWMNGRTSNLENARDGRRAAASALERSHAAEYAGISSVLSDQTRAGTQGGLGQQVVDPLGRELDLSNRELDLSRQAIAAALSEDGGGYNELRDQLNETVDEYNALIQQTDTLISDLTGVPAPLRREEPTIQ